MTRGQNERPVTGLVVVNYGSHELIEDNFSWVPPNGANSHLRMVIVDNHKTDAATESIRDVARRRGWDLVECQENRGFGAGANVGLTHLWEAGCAVGVLVNPDIKMQFDDAMQLSDACARDDLVFVSPLVKGPDGRPWGRLGSVDMTWGRIWTDERTPTTWLSGACLAGSRRLWTMLDGFDDDYVMYWEDVDLCLRAAKAGARMVVQAQVEVYHSIGGTQERVGGKTALYHYYNCRNRLMFAGKHLRAGRRWWWALATPADARRVVNRGLPRSRSAKVKDALGPALKGCLSGLAWLVLPSYLSGLSARRRKALPTPVRAGV